MPADHRRTYLAFCRCQPWLQRATGPMRRRSGKPYCQLFLGKVAGGFCALGMHAGRRSWHIMLMITLSLQASLQTVHIKRFWEQHIADPKADVEQMEALLMASLQVSCLVAQPLLPVVAASSLQELCTVRCGADVAPTPAQCTSCIDSTCRSTCCQTLVHKLVHSFPSSLLMHILQTLCAVVQHHRQLIKQLQQQMWASLGSHGQASAASVLLGLQHRYTRTAEAMLTIAAPTSVVGMASAWLQTNSFPSVNDSV